MLYITASSTKEAEKISTTLVKERLVACANILGTSTSIYRWDEKLVSENEIVVILKTSSALVQTSIKRIVELHSYDCPAVVVLNIENGNEEFLNWINNSTTKMAVCE